jgi:hypothetical protein
MLLSGAPTKTTVPFANSGAKNTIPVAASATPGLASYTTGFPALTMTPLSAGGIPPAGQDFNGILNAISQAVQYYSAGATFAYDSTFSSAVGGYPKGAIVQRADGTGFWFNTVDANTTNPDASGAGWTAYTASNSAYRVQGLSGLNNATTPNSQFDFSALAVTLRNPATGATAVATNTGTITNNVALAGPAANGRDQAGTFAASQWIHFYFIWNPTTSTLATISSLAAPTVGPTLPSGFTAWAYISAVYYGSSSALAVVRMKGSWCMYQTPQISIAAGGATTPAPTSIATMIPPNALEFEIVIQNLAITSTAAGLYIATLALQVESSNNAYQCGLQGTGGASTTFGVAGGSKRLQALSQGYNYSITVGAGTGQSATISISGYSMPNGGE